MGLDHLTAQSWVLPRAKTAASWPGEGATVSVVVLWLWLGNWTGPFRLDDAEVDGISTLLRPQTRSRGKPHELAENRSLAFIGSKPRGEGFVLEPGEAATLLRQGESYSSVIRPFLSGRDLNTSPTGTASRYVVDFADRDEPAARMFPRAFEILEERVRPDRQRLASVVLRDKWWLHEHRARRADAAIEGKSRTLAIAEVSKTVQPAFVTTDQVFMQKVIVFAYDDFFHFGVLSSAFHWWWAVVYAASLRNDPSYSPSDVFNTFPSQLRSTMNWRSRPKRSMSSARTS